MEVRDVGCGATSVFEGALLLVLRLMAWAFYFGVSLFSKASSALPTEISLELQDRLTYFVVQAAQRMKHG